MSSKEEDAKNVRNAEKFIKNLNEKSFTELREMEVIDRIGEIMEVAKMIQEKEARDKAEECVNELARLVAAFNSNFDQRSREVFPCC